MSDDDLRPINRFALLAAYAATVLRPERRPPARHRRVRTPRPPAPLSADDLAYVPSEYLSPTTEGTVPDTGEETDQQ